jgi:very-short-patch-repair endonuclease
MRAPGSPIERKMFDVLRVVASENGLEIGAARARFGDAVEIELQAYIEPVGHVDFVVSTTFGDKIIRIVVECDGHDWHEREPWQASRDRRRDRVLQRRGYVVNRFTGRDIFHDARGCAREVIDTLIDWLSQQAADAHDQDLGVIGNAERL